MSSRKLYLYLLLPPVKLLITILTKFDDPNPRGSKYPNSRVLGPKVHTLNGFWTLEPYYLGTWTLREPLKPCLKALDENIQALSSYKSFLALFVSLRVQRTQ